MVEIIAHDNNLCGEGPIWDAAHERLLWNDLASSLVFAFHPATGETSALSRGLMVSGIALHRDEHTLVFAGENGLHLWRGPEDVHTLAAEHEGETLVFNDILADPKGRLYAGTLFWGDDGMEKTGKLYLFDTDGSIRVADEGIELANGLGLSPGGDTLYFADSAARHIYAYDVRAEDGALANKRTWVRVPDEEGLPDGLTVDSEGFVWSAQWYGGQVVRYDPDGRVERRVPLPVTQASSVGFGGADLCDLYITTAGEVWPSDLAPPGYDYAAPAGGGLYRVRLEVAGLPEHQAALPWLP